MSGSAGGAKNKKSLSLAQIEQQLALMSLAARITTVIQQLEGMGEGILKIDNDFSASGITTERHPELIARKKLSSLKNTLSDLNSGSTDAINAAIYILWMQSQAIQVWLNLNDSLNDSNNDKYTMAETEYDNCKMEYGKSVKAYKEASKPGDFKSEVTHKAWDQVYFKNVLSAAKNCNKAKVALQIAEEKWLEAKYHKSSNHSNKPEVVSSAKSLKNTMYMKQQFTEFNDIYTQLQENKGHDLLQSKWQRRISLVFDIIGIFSAVLSFFFRRVIGRVLLKTSRRKAIDALPKPYGKTGLLSSVGTFAAKSVVSTLPKTSGLLNVDDGKTMDVSSLEPR